MTRYSSYGGRLALLMVLGLAAACSGSNGPAGTNGASGSNGANGADGSAGAPGPQGPAGPVTLTAETCAMCHGSGQLAEDAVFHKTAATSGLVRNFAKINSVTIPTSAPIKPVVTFQVNDKADFTGNPVAGLTSVSFTVAQLVSTTQGSQTFTNWRSLVNRNYGTTPIYVGGTTESPTTIKPGNAPSGQQFGTLVDNGGGSYTYTFGNDLSAPVTIAAGTTFGVTSVAFNPALPTRIGLQSGAPLPGAAPTVVTTSAPNATPVTTVTVAPTPPFNTTFDLSTYGSAQTTDNADPRALVSTAACNACHQRLTAHGRRLDVDYCVTCHNPYSADPKPPSGVTNTADANGVYPVPVDFKVVIHKLHMGENLPSVKAGGKFTFNGNDFSDVAFPQDLGNCTVCHSAPAGSGVTVAANWNTKPSVAACGACHDRTSFVNPPPTGFTLHLGGAQATDANCGFCHQAGVADGLGADIVHAIGAISPSAELSKNFKYEIVSVSNTAPGQKPVVTYKISNPLTSAGYDLATDPAWTSLADGSSRLAIIVGWGTKKATGSATVEYDNAGSGSNPGQPISMDGLKGTAVAGQAGTYTVTSTVAIPASAVGTGVAALEGHPADVSVGAGTSADAHGRIPVTSVVKYFGVTDTTVSARRSVVDVNKCQACHLTLSLHGNNRTGTVDICVVCHNTSATDVGRRPTAAGATTVDSKAEESIDFKRMIHGIHGAGAFPQADGSGNGPVIYGFGGSVNDFRNAGYPGVIANCEACHKTGTYNAGFPAVNGSTVSTSGDPATQAKFKRITKNTAACQACHALPLHEAHMQQNGGQFSVTQPAIDALNQ